ATPRRVASIGEPKSPSPSSGSGRWSTRPRPRPSPIGSNEPSADCRSTSGSSSPFSTTSSSAMSRSPRPSASRSGPSSHACAMASPRCAPSSTRTIAASASPKAGRHERSDRPQGSDGSRHGPPAGRLDGRCRAGPRARPAPRGDVRPDDVGAAGPQRPVGKDHDRTDPTGGKVTATITLGKTTDLYNGVASGAGTLWATNWDAQVLYRVDPKAGKVTASIPVGLTKGVFTTPGAVWIANTRTATVMRLDSATNKIVATTTVGPTGASGPNWLAIGFGSIWVDVPNN